MSTTHNEIFALASPILTWLFYIVIDILWNFVKIVHRKKKPDYFGAFCRRAMVGFLIMLIVNPYFDPLGSWTSILESVPFVMFEVCSFYLVFDPALNWARGLKWYYKGKDSGYLDDLPMWAYIILKIVCLIGLPVSLMLLL